MIPQPQRDGSELKALYFRRPERYATTMVDLMSNRPNNTLVVGALGYIDENTTTGRRLRFIRGAPA